MRAITAGNEGITGTPEMREYSLAEEQ